MSMTTRPLKSTGPLDPNNLKLSRWTRWLVITLTLIAWLCLGILLWWLIGHIIGTVIMVAIAFLLAYALYPIVNLLARFMPRKLAVLIVYIIIFGGIVTLIYFLIRTAIAQVEELIEFMQAYLRGDRSPSQLGEILTTLGVTQDQIQQALNQTITALSGLVNRVPAALGQVFSGFLNTLLVAVLSIYALFVGPQTANWLRNHTPLSQRQQIGTTIDTIKRVVGGYVRGQLLLSSVLSTITGTAMAIIGVPYALFIGVLAFLLSFIPTIGAFTTGIICVLLALTQSLQTALFALGFLLLLQLLETQVLSPRILGPAVGLHPAVALIALIAGGELFGLAGALFASLLAGLIQALIVALWSAWKEENPEEFYTEETEQPDKEAEKLALDKE